MTINKIIKASVCVALTATLFSCSSKRGEGRAYMPDMTYSRAYETYADAQTRLDESGAESKPVYSKLPVKGTIARGDMMPYALKNDSTGYAQSVSVTNPIDLASVGMKESERLYLVNCGICHGTKLDGNGPLYNNGNGPFAAAPKNLMGDDMKAMAGGTMFHSITYGKGQMGSYASQMTPQQRWMVVAYIKSKQGFGKPVPDSTGTTKVDTVATAMKK